MAGASGYFSASNSNARNPNRQQFSRPQFDRAQSNPQQFNRPQSNRSQYNESQSNMPQFDRPQFDRSQLERPQFNQPRFSRPQSNRPQFDQPYHGRPQLDQPHHGRPGSNRPPLFDRPHHDRLPFDRAQFSQSQFSRPQFNAPNFNRPPQPPVIRPQPPVTRPQLEFHKLTKSRGQGPSLELRLLVRERHSGPITGPSGSNLKRIRQQYDVTLFMPESSSPERILSLVGSLGSICHAILDLVPMLDYLPGSNMQQTEVRLLMHHSQTGSVIGKNGSNISDFKRKTNASPTVFKMCCPRSSDRIVQIAGRPTDVVNCLAAIVDWVVGISPVGPIEPYDPINYSEIMAVEYGGYTYYDVTIPFQPDLLTPPPPFPPVTDCGTIEGQQNSSTGDDFDEVTNEIVGLAETIFGVATGGMQLPFNRNELEEMIIGSLLPKGSTADAKPPKPAEPAVTVPPPRPPVPVDPSLPKLKFLPVDGQTVQVIVPKMFISAVMGHRSCAIKSIREESKSRIAIEIPPAGATERVLTIQGSPEQLQKAQYILQTRLLAGIAQMAEGPKEPRRREHPNAPWMTDEILKFKAVKRKAERMMRQQKTEESQAEFKKKCVEMNTMIRKAKEEYYKIHGGGPEKKKKVKEEGEASEEMVAEGGAGEGGVAGGSGEDGNEAEKGVDTMHEEEEADKSDDDSESGEVEQKVEDLRESSNVLDQGYKQDETYEYGGYVEGGDVPQLAGGYLDDGNTGTADYQCRMDTSADAGTMP